MDRSIRVLSVDSEPDAGDLAAGLSGGNGDRFEVVTTVDAEAALARLHAERIDCVVAGYELSGTDGIELLEQVRREYPELPFVLVTGQGSEELASEAIAAGVTDYLQRNHESTRGEVLAKRIENAVTQYRARRALAERTRELETLHRSQGGCHGA